MSSAATTRGALASLYAAMLPPIASREPAIDVDAIAADAYRAGLAAGMAEAEAGLASDRTALRSAAQALTAASVVDHDALRAPFVALVTALGEAVVAAELRSDPELVRRLVDTALNTIEVRNGISVRVHPDDLASLDLELPVVADPSLPRGSVTIDGPDFVIHDGLNLRLAAVIEAMA